MKNSIILLILVPLLSLTLVTSQSIEDLTNIEDQQQISFEGSTHNLFSAYNDSIQGIYHQIDNNTILNTVHNTGQNNSHPNAIEFDNKLYVVWQGWVEFPPAAPNQTEPEPQYSIYYKYYQDEEWSGQYLVYPETSYTNEDPQISLDIDNNELQVTFYDFVSNTSRTESIAEATLLNKENTEEVTIENTTHQVFSAYNDSVQGIYYQVKGDDSTLTAVHTTGQNNTYPKLIGFNDKLYVAWQGWVEYPPAAPNQTEPEPQYSLYYKTYGESGWSGQYLIEREVSYTNLNTKLNLTVEGNQLIASFYNYVNESEQSVTLAETYTDSVQGVKDALTYKLILNGNINKTKVVSKLYLPTALEDVEISWASNNTNVISTNGTVTRSNSTDQEVLLTATLEKGVTSDTKEFTLNVKKQLPPTTPNANGTIDISTDTEVVLDNSSISNLKKVQVPDTISDEEEVVLNLDTLIDVNKSITLGSNDLTLSRDSSSGVSYSVEIPASTKIQGEDNWNGLITIPTVKETSEVSLSSGTADLVIEVGSTGVKLTFDKAVKLTLPGKAGKYAGYVGTDDVFTSISSCSSSELADPNTLPDEGNCFTESGDDMIIWTKHFTKFVSFTPDSSSSSSSGSSSSSSGGGPLYIPPGPIEVEKVQVEVIQEPEPTQIVEPIPVEEPAPIPQEEQGFFDLLTGAVIGGGNFEGLKGPFFAVIVIAVGIFGYYLSIVKRRREEEPEEEYSHLEEDGYLEED